jgi:hypothetical protein
VRSLPGFNRKAPGQSLSFNPYNRLIRKVAANKQRHHDSNLTKIESLDAGRAEYSYGGANAELSSRAAH